LNTLHDGLGKSGRGTGLFVVLCGCLLALLVAEHGWRMERAAFTTHDDLTSDLTAAEVRAGGLSVLWKKASEAARGQGRIGYYASYPFVLAPYIIDSDTARAAVVTGTHFLSVAALAAFLGLYLGWRIAMLAAVAIYALLPHWWQHFPIAAYPVQFHAAVLSFFAAAILLVLSTRLNGRAWALRAAAAALLIPALSVYETSSLLFAVTLALALRSEWRSATRTRRRAVAETAAVALAAFLLYGAAYVGFRLLHRSTYHGNQITAASLLNVRAAVGAAVAYAAGGLPLAHLYRQAEIVSRFSPVSVFELGWARFLSHMVTPLGILEAVLLAAPAWLGLRGCVPNRRRAAGVGAAALAMALLAPVPSAVTLRYQQNAWAITPYVTGYFSYLCYAVAICCAAAVAASYLGRMRRGIAVALLVPVATGLASAVAVSQGANDAIVRSQAAHYDTWRLAKLLMRSKEFAALPQDAVLIAPGLWDEISPEWPHYESYWGRYFAAHSGKPVRVMRREEFAPEGAPRYYVEIQRKRYPGRSALAFHRDGAQGNWERLLVISAATPSTPEGGAARTAY
jgi:hypothetical protein